MNNTINTATLQSLGLLQSPAGAAAGTSAAGNSAQLSQSEFLSLMTTQLKNQDPLQPLDSAQFLGQLAQFGTVSGIDNLQSSVSQLSTSLTANQAVQAAGLVGHSALVAQSVGTLAAGGQLRGAAQLPVGATGGTVKIYDMSGQVVRTIPLNATGGGMASFTWNGIEDDGSQAPAGQYQITAAANSGGKSTALQTYVAAPIASVVLGNSGSNGGLSLDLTGVGQVPLSQVQQIM